MTVEVQQDGLTYVITMTEPLGHRTIVGLLREDPDGWFIVSDTLKWSYRIGRHKTWQKALHDALVYLEQHMNLLP